MPISREEFKNLDRKSESLKDKLIDFLRENSDKAFTVIELSNELGAKMGAVSPYLNFFQKENRVIHKDNYWMYNPKQPEKKETPFLKFLGKKSKGDENMWKKIYDYLQHHKNMQLISPSSKGQSFIIEELSDWGIKIGFTSSGNKIRVEKERFEAAYNYLKENKANWIKIGASRIATNPETIEGQIKLAYNGNMNGLSTASWVATILVNVFDDIEFNGKFKGQALRMR